MREIVHFFIYKHKYVCLLLLSCISLFSSWIGSQYITERYFFDKLYYQKSPKFGYIDEQNYINNEIVLERANGIDLIPYENHVQKVHVSSQSGARPYSIVVIGDSNVWGRGIQIKDRFSNRLEYSLNLKRPTKIYTLGFPGDNFSNNLTKYLLVSQRNAPDLYIFVLVSNDILVTLNTKLHLTSTEETIILHKCELLGNLQYDYYSNNWDTYLRYMNAAWENPPNICTITEGSKFLPKNAIYLILDSNSINQNMYEKYVEYLSTSNIPVSILGENSPGIETYTPYWKNVRTNFQVSGIEGHPSSLANEMYAAYLYHQIMTKSQYKFIEN